MTTRIRRLPLNAKRAQALLDGRDEVQGLIDSMGFGRSHDTLVRFLAALDAVLPPQDLEARVVRARGEDPDGPESRSAADG